MAAIHGVVGDSIVKSHSFSYLRLHRFFGTVEATVGERVGDELPAWIRCCQGVTRRRSRPGPVEMLQTWQKDSLVRVDTVGQLRADLIDRRNGAANLLRGEVET